MLHRSYDDWKAAHDWSGGGVADRKAASHTKMLWFRAWRHVRQQGPDHARRWLDEQRQYPAFAHFVKEADAHLRRWHPDDADHS